MKQILVLAVYSHDLHVALDGSISPDAQLLSDCRAPHLLVLLQAGKACRHSNMAQSWACVQSKEGQQWVTVCHACYCMSHRMGRALFAAMRQIALCWHHHRRRLEALSALGWS